MIESINFKSKLNSLLDEALVELHLFYNDSIQYGSSSEVYLFTERVLILLKDGLIKEKPEWNVAVVRAVHDLGISSYRIFENTDMEKIINKICDLICEYVPAYSQLEPLSKDYKIIFSIE